MVDQVLQLLLLPPAVVVLQRLLLRLEAMVAVAAVLFQTTATRLGVETGQAAQRLLLRLDAMVAVAAVLFQTTATRLGVETGQVAPWQEVAAAPTSEEVAANPARRRSLAAP